MTISRGSVIGCAVGLIIGIAIGIVAGRLFGGGPVMPTGDAVTGQKKAPVNIIESKLTKSMLGSQIEGMAEIYAPLESIRIHYYTTDKEGALIERISAYESHVPKGKWRFKTGFIVRPYEKFVQDAIEWRPE